MTANYIKFVTINLKEMFASHASDMYAVGGRQNVWKASYTYLFSCGTLIELVRDNLKCCHLRSHYTHNHQRRQLK